ncbi:MAG TPA: CRTAC1 family protein [Candidatus Binatia bacterium]|jgi:hypothetical protein
MLSLGGRWCGVLAIAMGCASACHRAHRHAPPAFADVTAQAGIARNTPTYDAAIGDFDGDGRPDVYVGNHGAGAVLLHNLGDGRFADVLPAAGIEPAGDQHGTAWTDIDNDGRPDLVVALGAGRGLGTKQNHLYHNLGGGRFEDVAAAAGTGDVRGRSRSVASFDFDGDGWLDIVNANMGSPSRLFLNRHDGTFEDASERAGLAAWPATRVAWADLDGDGRPDLLLSGTPKGLRLLHNEDGQRFVDVTDASGLGSQSGWLAGMTIGDYDNDGILDLYVTIGTEFSDVVHDEPDGRVTFAFFAKDAPAGIDFETTGGADADLDAELYENGAPVAPDRVVCGAGPHPATSRFTCRAAAAAASAAPTTPLGFVLWRDVETVSRCAGCAPAAVWHLRWTGSGDHHLTGILRGATHATAVGFQGELHRGGELFHGLPGGRFERVRGPAHQDANGQAAQWADIDGDGWLDLYVVDSGLDGAGGRNVVCMGDGRGGLEPCRNDTSLSPSSGGGRGSGAHFFDFDGDGRLDLFLTNGWGAPPFDRGPYYLLRNAGPATHWIAFDLQGTRSNRLALGALVTVEACGTRQTRFQNGGADYFSQSLVRPQFGVGACAGPVTFRVRWPSGAVTERRDVALDAVVHVTEGS